MGKEGFPPPVVQPSRTLHSFTHTLLPSPPLSLSYQGLYFSSSSCPNRNTFQSELTPQHMISRDRLSLLSVSVIGPSDTMLPSWTAVGWSWRHRCASRTAFFSCVCWRPSTQSPHRPHSASTHLPHTHNLDTHTASRYSMLE